MRRIRSWAAALIVLGVSLASAGPQPAGPPEVEMLPGPVAAPGQVVQLQRDGVVPGLYIVVFHDDVSDPRGLGNALAAQHGFALRHSYAFALKGFAARMPDPVAQALAADPDVAYVEPDVYAQALLHANNFQTLPTGVVRIDADLNATANIDGVDDRVDVDIAIIDTGIDLVHPDLNVHRGVDCTKGPSCEKGGDGNDGNGHGTHVAGTAAALDNGIGVVGMAPGARLWAVKVLDNSGRGTFADVIAGIDFVTAHADEIEVSNMSLGGRGSLASLRTALQTSVAAGVVHVVAAGNSASDVYGTDGVFATNDDFIPASYPEVAAISALADSDGQAGGYGPDTSYYGPDDTLASFSNFSAGVVAGNPVTSSGAAIDLAAPGVDITSTYKDGLYVIMSGTSMASPHVAGAVALEIATHGRAIDATGVAAIRQALIDAAEAQPNWGPANTNDPDTNPEGLANVAGGPSNARPVVSVTSPVPPDTTFESLANVSFAGSASDTEDDDAILTGDLVWTANGTWIGDGASFSATLDDGEHTITASVTDSGGKTGSASFTITVGTPPPEPETVTVDAITYYTGGGRNQNKNLYITIGPVVDDLGGLVSVASVSITLTHNNGRQWSGTGSTGDGGTLTFSLNKAPHGCYTTTVTSLTAAGLTWDGVTPENETCK